MIDYIASRKRLRAMPALRPVRISWRALPVITGDVCPAAFGSQTVAANDARDTNPGLLAWSPPI